MQSSNIFPTLVDIRKALRLPSTYRTVTTVSAPYVSDGRHNMRMLYVLSSPTRGTVTVYAAWLADTGVIELSPPIFRQIIARHFDIGQQDLPGA